METKIRIGDTIRVVLYGHMVGQEDISPELIGKEYEVAKVTPQGMVVAKGCPVWLAPEQVELVEKSTHNNMESKQQIERGDIVQVVWRGMVPEDKVPNIIGRKFRVKDVINDYWVVAEDCPCYLEVDNLALVARKPEPDFKEGVDKVVEDLRKHNKGMTIDQQIKGLRDIMAGYGWTMGAQDVLNSYRNFLEGSDAPDLKAPFTADQARELAKQKWNDGDRDWVDTDWDSIIRSTAQEGWTHLSASYRGVSANAVSYLELSLKSRGFQVEFFPSGSALYQPYTMLIKW